MIDIIGSFALLASAIVANKICLRYMPPSLFVMLRMLCAGIILFIIVFWLHKKNKTNLPGRIRAHILPLTLAAFFTTFLNSLLKSYALSHMAAAKASALGALDPFITAIFAYMLWNEKLRPLQWLGIGCAIIGTFVLTLSTTPLEEMLGWWSIISLPELAQISAVAISRYGWIMLQSMLKKSTFTPLEINAVIMIIGGLFSLISTISGIDGGFLWYGGPLFTFMGTFIYTVIIGNIFVYTLYAMILKKYSSSFVSVASLSVPLFVALFGYSVLKEIPSWHFFASLGFFVLAILLFIKKKKEVPSSNPSSTNTSISQ